MSKLAGLTFRLIVSNERTSLSGKAGLELLRCCCCAGVRERRDDRRVKQLKLKGDTQNVATGV